MPEILARLDSTGLRVLCGSGGNICRGELARVAVIEGGKRVLCMLDGCKHKAGSRSPWVESNHAGRNRRGAEHAVSHGTLAPAQLEKRAAPRFRQPIPEERDVNRAAYGLASDNYVVFPGPDGVLATCPRCGHDNTLTAANLRVATL